MKFQGVLMAAVLAAASFTAQAQEAASPLLPKPAEFYFDADANATKPVVAVRETGEAAMAKLLKLIERNPHASAERAQLAHLAMEAGRVDLGRELYARALQRLDTSDAAWRAVMWNYGWDLYRSGDDAAAVAQWRALLMARGVTAAWMPPTFAMALWSLDRKDEAVQWYAAAVRSEPQQWASSARYAQLLPDWLEAERATLAEVQAAWAANPPAFQ